jgi:hypothetical protein
MKRLLLLAILVACKTSNGDDFPVEPGGPGPGGVGMMLDGPELDASDPDAMTTLTGRVCLVKDLRKLTTCEPMGAGNITVKLGTQTALTSATGAFTITKPGGSNLVWRASGAAIVSSVFAFGPTNVIPAIGVQDYLDLQGANGVVLVQGQGSIIARIVRNNVPQAGATARVPNVASKYDGGTPLVWTDLTTGAAGTAWIPGIAPGTPVVTTTPASGPATMESVLVEDQAITYVTIDLP